MRSQGHVVILVPPDVAQKLADGIAPSPAADGLIDSILRIGIQWYPLNDGTEDPRSSRYFFCHVADVDDPVALARSLAELEGVEAAYYKPPDEAP